MKSALIIINYECPHFLFAQLQKVDWYMMPDAVYVYDTSRNDERAYEVQKVAELFNDVTYNRLRIDEGDNSRHHAMALNIAYEDVRPYYDTVGILDHDCFPFKPYPIWELAAQNTFVCIGQAGNYPHPGYLFINTKKAGFLNFLPIEGKDTGGRIELHDTFAMSFHYCHEPEHEIIGGFLMHFIKGSNWHGEDVDMHRARIARLLEKLSEYESSPV